MNQLGIVHIPVDQCFVEMYHWGIWNMTIGPFGVGMIQRGTQCTRIERHRFDTGRKDKRRKQNGWQHQSMGLQYRLNKRSKYSGRLHFDSSQWDRVNSFVVLSDFEMSQLDSWYTMIVL